MDNEDKLITDKIDGNIDSKQLRLEFDDYSKLEK